MPRASRDIQDPPNSGIYYSVIVPATVDTSAGRNALVCYSPPPRGRRGHELRVSADADADGARQRPPAWTNVQRTSTLPPVTPPTLSPGCGPVSGATIVALTGKGMRATAARRLPGYVGRLAHDGLSCGYGARHTVATRTTDELARCATPDLHSGGARRRPHAADPPAAVIDFVEADANRSAALAAATIAAPVCRLRQSVREHHPLRRRFPRRRRARSPTSGLALLAVRGDDTSGPNASGALIVTRALGAVPLAAFDLALEVLLDADATCDGNSGAGRRQQGGGLRIEYGPRSDGNVALVVAVVLGHGGVLATNLSYARHRPARPLSCRRR